MDDADLFCQVWEHYSHTHTDGIHRHTRTPSRSWASKQQLPQSTRARNYLKQEAAEVQNMYKKVLSLRWFHEAFGVIIKFSPTNVKTLSFWFSKKHSKQAAKAAVWAGYTWALAINFASVLMWALLYWKASLSLYRRLAKASLSDNYLRVFTFRRVWNVSNARKLIQGPPNQWTSKRNEIMNERWAFD